MGFGSGIARMLSFWAFVRIRLSHEDCGSFVFRFVFSFGELRDRCIGGTELV